ncbi:hypothetical protein [Streptomyces sp. NPDC057438]|uniref:hypothetical protein n=1 Tax=Streptomyces sp. NPDC057438 TaxID=3346133 RepID=UPI00368FCBEA
MITAVEEGGAMGQGIQVVRALLSAIATLEDLAEVGDDSSLALSTLEDIASELGGMGAEERRCFIKLLESVAAEEPNQAAWIRGIPAALGLERDA